MATVRIFEVMSDISNVLENYTWWKYTHVQLVACHVCRASNILFCKADISNDMFYFREDMSVS
jgi:hypothetical protein